MSIKTSTIAKSVKLLSIGVAISPSLAIAQSFESPTLKTSQTDFGGVGLMQVPSGRVAPEGEFSFGATFNDNYHHATVSLQLMPWFETTIRYTQAPDLLYSQDSDFSGDTKYTDKGIDFKVRLWEESYWLPETSVGVRDFGGTGLFDGEFVAATKRFGNIDFTLGMGWGYLGQRGTVTNPFCKVRDEFCVRDNSFKGNGGSVDYARWFKGPAAIFGGIEYQTPYQPLVLKVEYEGNDYSEDFPVQQADVDMTQHTPWNFGIVYRPSDWADIRVSYQRGDTLTLGVTAKTNFNTMSSVWRDTPKPDYKPKSNSSPNWEKVAQQLESNAGYKQNKVIVSENEITVVGEQTKYRDLDLAHERGALILSQNRADTVDTYTFVESNYDLKLKETKYDADAFDEVANNGYIGASLDDARISAPDASSSDNGKQVGNTYDRFDYGFSPSLSQSFGGPESFYLYAIGVNTSASYRLTNNLELSGALYFNLADNYDKFNYIEDSPHINNFSTPRVRTLFRHYVHDNPVRMSNLQLTWFEQLSDSIYIQGYGGYLESMFAGVGGEILYRPEGSNWAVSADANLISQRDPDNWFSIYNEDYFEYDGGCPNGVPTPSCAAYVLSRGETGFVSVYYMPQFELLRNTRFKVSLGKFLGQDVGGRFDFSKQFDSGVITGAYASITNLSADEFGEGSFTKGFYISLPLDMLTIKPSRSRAEFNWQPITRDGGQILNRKYELFDVTDSRSPWFTRPVTIN
ncbi:YjbH domain-containing protein [Vibrio hannami]|uniref:YjbH domain-containing protein n=1 Tax=Vibrio hannami TaxID=2717094 RepID=UPI00240F0A7E|nr:YjbH domain-containing protein [Vibrio hannami]MDG3088671.1 YjbH domain-containing protein [Vibrio hannami]